MGIVTRAGVPDVSARLPARRDRPVHAPHRARRARQQARVGDGDHPGARRGAPEDRQVDRLHVGRLGLPDRRARGDGAARRALRGVQDRARAPHRQARGRPRDRAAVHRRRPATTCARRTGTTTRSSRSGRTTSRSSRDAGKKVHGVGKISDIFAGVDIDESHPTKSNIEGIQQTEKLLQELDDGLHLHEPRRDRLALGPPQRPGQLPPLPAGLRPPAARPARGAAPGRPARPHLRPRLRPDDAVDRPLARARDAARLRRRPQRRRPDPRGRVRGRRRDRERVAEGQAALARHPGPADPRRRDPRPPS